jgi:hypothetical protein
VLKNSTYFYEKKNHVEEFTENVISVGGKYEE